MTAQIINGKEIALKVRNHLKCEIERFGIKPKLAVILVGHDVASEIYVKNKQKAAFEAGIETELFAFEESTTQEELEKLIIKLNNDSSFNGIMLQLPVPKHINGNELIKKIDPIKDVDGFHPFNIGLLQNNDSKATIAATPKGVLRLLKETNIDLKSLKALVIGRSIIVGKPMAMLLLNQNCTVTIAHSFTQNLPDLIKSSDLIVSACGHPKLIKAEWLKSGSIVVDVGICHDENGKLCGDVDFEKAKNVASYITPVPGGVGPMTIAMLLENTFEAYLKQHC